MSNDPDRPEESPGERSDWTSRSVDDRFNDIIAHWDEATAEPARPRPQVAPDEPPQPDAGDISTGGARDTATGDTADDPGERAGESAGDPPAGIDPSGGARLGEPTDEAGHPPGWRSYEVEEAEPHFEPPPPPPLPAGDLHFWAILLGLVGGPLLLIVHSVVSSGGSQLWTWVGIAMSVGGFALLVARLPASRGEDDDDGTGGARL